MGIIEHQKDAPIRDKKKYFADIFERIGLHYNDEVPHYHSEDDFNEYAKGYIFYSLIPISEWHKKKEILETHLNVKILDIVQSLDDNRFTYVTIQKKLLPTMIEWDDDYIQYDDYLVIGQSYYDLEGMDLNNYPHAFIAGESGSGKSNILKCMIYQAIQKNYDVVLIDFKRGVSFATFQDVAPIYYDYKETLEVLRETLEETKNRLDLFRKYEVENLNEYNELTNSNLKRMIIFVDELAELLSTSDKEISKLLYEYIETLTRLSRSAGIHLIMGIQRPDSTVINGQIKSNVSFRVCGHFADKEPSRIMLGNDKASTIQNIKGRFLIKEHMTKEIQSFYYQNSLNKPYRDVFEETQANNQAKEETLNIELETVDKEEYKELEKPIFMNFDFSGYSEIENRDKEESEVL